MAALRNIGIFFITDYIPDKQANGNIIFKTKFEQNSYFNAYQAVTNANGYKIFEKKISLRVHPVTNDAQRAWVLKNWNFNIPKNGYPFMMFVDFYDDDKSYTPLSVIAGMEMTQDRIFDILEFFAGLQKERKAGGKPKYIVKDKNGKPKEWKPFIDKPEKEKKEGNQKPNDGKPNGNPNGDRTQGPDGRDGGGKDGSSWGRDKNILDDFFGDAMKKLREALPMDIIYIAGAAYCAFKAIDSNNTTGKVFYTGGAAFLAFLAAKEKGLFDTDKEKKKTNGIGKLEKSKFIPVYKNYGVPELGWRSETNIKFAQGKPGVYLIKRNNKIVYIGAGANVYKTALRHFEPHPPDSTGKNKQEYWRDYDYNDYTIRIVLTGNRDRAARLEAALINKHLPPDNHHIPEMNFDRKTEKIIDEYNDEPPF